MELKKIALFVAIISFVATTPMATLAATYYVEKNADEDKADGSKNNPFNSLEDAIEAAKKSSGDVKIYLGNGTFKGGLTVPKGVDITGKGAGKTTIQGSGGNTLFLNGGNAIKKLTIEGGSKGIVIAKNATATIENCAVKKTTDVGIETSKSTKMPSRDIVIRDSKISNNSGKGLYVQKTGIQIAGNEVRDNGQEGIDVRQGVQGVIKNNNASSNKESGIELIIGKSDLKIVNNKIRNNDASGISTQYYKDFGSSGSVVIQNNDINGNDKFGVDCSIPQGGGYAANYWSDSISQSQNTFAENNRDTFAPRCKFIPSPVVVPISPKPQVAAVANPTTNEEIIEPNNETTPAENNFLQPNEGNLPQFNYSAN